VHRGGGRGGRQVNLSEFRTRWSGWYTSPVSLFGRSSVWFWGPFLAVSLGIGLTIAGSPRGGNLCFVIFGVILTLALLHGVRNVLAVGLTRELCRKGDYERALSRIRRLGLGMPSGFLLDVEGGILGLARKNLDAERCLRAALDKNDGHAKRRALTLLKLGFTLDELGRHEEARHYFQTVVRLGDRTGSARIGLAALLLDRNGAPQQALELIERTEAATRPRWTIKARALAKLGRREEAEQAIARALEGADPGFRAVCAGVHYDVGRALLDLGETLQAIEHLRIARDSDPGGHNGSLALRKLEALAG
jgi:tetratricopeptide (TPR) repeat protein